MTNEELLELQKESFRYSKLNKNMMSYWLPKVINCGIKVPDTTIVQLEFEDFIWLISDNYRKEDIEKFSKKIISKLDKAFNTNRTLFVKTGNFSNKFVFSFCKLDGIEKIGEQFLNVFYGGMCVGCEDSTEVVIREYIEPKHNRGTIYLGMPLNTEFRVFYDFDTKEILGCFNYWDKETMLKSLRNEDLITFKDYADEIEQDYLQNRKTAIELIENAMENVNLEGKWSIDLMKIGEDYYLIDMALAEQSYYYERL